jgi:hypothetical protein
MLANAQKDDDILEVSKRGLDELQSDLDECLKEYNTERSHSGKYCYAKTRLQTFLDSKGLAQDKMSDRTLTSSSDIQSQRAEPETERSHAERSAGGGIARGAAALNLLVCQIKSRSEQLIRTVIIPATFSISQLLVNSSSCCL